MLTKLIRAWRLDRKLYGELQADSHTLVQAFGIVALMTLSLWLGGMALALTQGQDFGARALALAWIAPSAFMAWVLWALLVYFIGGRLFRRAATFGQLLRALGFAHSPGTFYVLIFIPEVGVFINLGVLLWVLVSALVAVRTILRVSTSAAFWLSFAGIVLSLVLRDLFRP